MVALFDELQLGALRLKNRVVMAPMTRSRAAPGDMPTALMAEYYRQRAGAGLIVSEGIAPCASGIGYCRTPGIYNEKQAEAWAEILRAVHAEGGLMAAQLMHCGRIASRHNKAADSETVAPSAVQAQGEIYTDTAGMAPFESPKALAREEIPAVVEDYRQAAQFAFAAGFDAVELHCTSGYLPAQFLSTGTNRREDDYGGDAASRSRFPLEVLRALISAGEPGRVGFRICPDNPFNDLQDDDPAETFSVFLAAAAELNLAYCHVIRYPKGRVDNLALAARYFSSEKNTQIIGNESYTRDEAEAAIESGQLAAVSFGRPFIANPDLPQRFQRGWPLAELNHKTLYTPGSKGYTDYEVYAE